MTSGASNGTPKKAKPISRRLSKRTTVIGSTVAGVLVLAAVIFAVSALSSPDADSGSISVRPPSEQSADMYSQALDKLKSGDETAAVTLLRQALTLDPDNQQAQNELDRIVKNRATADDSDDDDDPADPDPDDPVDPDDDDEFDQEVADLSVLLPDAVEGYEVGMVVVQGPDAQVPADPTDEGPSTVVRRALFSVHDRGTAADAQAFVNNVTKTAFTENGAQVTVNGVDAYFGTDGERFATVSYSRGRYVFEVIVTAEDGAPGALVDVVIEAASAFPTSL